MNLLCRIGLHSWVSRESIIYQQGRRHIVKEVCCVRRHCRHNVWTVISAERTRWY